MHVMEIFVRKPILKESKQKTQPIFRVFSFEAVYFITKSIEIYFNFLLKILFASLIDSETIKSYSVLGF